MHRTSREITTVRAHPQECIGDGPGNSANLGVILDALDGDLSVAIGAGVIRQEPVKIQCDVLAQDLRAAARSGQIEKGHAGDRLVPNLGTRPNLRRLCQ